LLLLIEEPETYLHPFAIETTRVALQKLAKNGYQVIVVTHSPVFISEEDIADTVLLRKDAGGTKSLGTMRTKMAASRSAHITQSEMLFSLTSSNQLLFADRVLLAEGPTERRLLPVLYECIHGRPPMADKLAILGMGSCDAFAPARDILGPLGIPTWVLCDMDHAMRSAEEHGLVAVGDPDIAACQRLVATVPGVIIDPRTKWPRDGAEQSFAAMASMPVAQPYIAALHAKLKTKGYWFWPLGSIEHHLGLGGKKLKHHSAFKEKAQKDWKTACVDPVGVESFIRWLAVP